MRLSRSVYKGRTDNWQKETNRTLNQLSKRIKRKEIRNLVDGQKQQPAAAWAGAGAAAGAGAGAVLLML
jgi:ribosomal protein L12E/L44/L45/RPP1/RPP2